MSFLTPKTDLKFDPKTGVKKCEKMKPNCNKNAPQIWQKSGTGNKPRQNCKHVFDPPVFVRRSSTDVGSSARNALRFPPDVRRHVAHMRPGDNTIVGTHVETMTASFASIADASTRHLLGATAAFALFCSRVQRARRCHLTRASDSCLHCAC